MESAATLEKEIVEKQSAHLVKMAKDIKLALPHLHDTAFNLFTIIGESGADQSEQMIDQMSTVFATGETSPILNAFTVVALALVVLEDIATVFCDEETIKAEVAKAVHSRVRDPRQTVVN